MRGSRHPVFLEADGWEETNPAGLASSPRISSVVSVMLINLRGTSGAGKTTVVRALMAQCSHKAIYGALGPRLPEAYELTLPLCDPVYVIGPYLTPCGGCDRILPFALVPQLIEKYAQQGHVV